jgi:beta-galactosidase
MTTDSPMKRFVTAALLGLIAASFVLNLSAQTVTSIVPDGKAHQFETRDHQFFIDGQPTMLVAGEMHFGRVQPEDWDTRIKQAKAMGLNTISFYLFWNQVETQEGEFNFTGMTDVRRVLKLCQKNGMWVVLRPGPYCCAEIEYGGIPWWTLKHPEVKVRTADPQWLAWCSNYLAQVYKQVGDLEVSKGGPLLMVQVENEYGITDPTNNDYMVAMTKVFKDVGFKNLFTCDPTTKVWSNPALRVPGLMYGRNGLASDERFRQSAELIGDYPVYVPEVYTAWFSGWGEPIAKKNSTIPQITNWVTYLLDHNDSFCLFCLFGGSNYGFDNGCAFFSPVQASYDYNAPIDEAGRTTEKYRALRTLLTERLKINPPEPPADPPVIEIPTIKLDQSEPLLQTLPRKPTLVSDKTVSMEDLNQDYGFVLYRKTFPNGLKGKLELKTAQDYTVVMVNGKTVGTAFVGDGLDSNKIELPETDGPATLDLLVYNLGRISVVVTADTAHLARKGLIGGATLDGADLSGWQIYSLPYYNVNNFKASAEQHTGPTFYRGTFILDKLGGTFLDMRNWSMGAVWVNGHNLGRFWDHGGLRSLFLPGEWLKRGQNEIVILELHDAPKLAEVSGGTKIIEEPAVPFAVKLDRADLKAPITPAAPEDTNAPGKLLPLKVVGTKILDSNNQPVRLRGVNAASLEWTSDGDGHILQTVNVAIRDWHVNIIRLPLSQDRWFGKAPEQNGNSQPYRDLVHQVVDECATQNCYIILDLHWSDCNEWGHNIGQHSMPDTNSIVFWKDFAPLYANNPAVLFDLYNEPHDVSWDVWLSGGQITDKPVGRNMAVNNYHCVGMQAMLDAVRSTGAKNVVICGGLDWAYDFSGILDGRQLSDPNGNGVIYSNHCYDNKGDSVDTWIAKMETATARLPVIVSEFGGNSGPSKKVPTDNWLLHVLQAIEDHQWSYTAWDLHPAAGPRLVSDWNYTPSPRYGVFVKETLEGKLPAYTPPAE